MDVRDNRPQFPQIAGQEVRSEALEQRLHLAVVPVEEAGDVAFVDRHAVELALPIQRRQRIKFQEHEPLGGRGGNIQFGKTVRGAKKLLRCG